MRLLVTGGAGFIGSAVCRLAAGEFGWSVCNVDKLTYAGNLDSVKPVSDRSDYRFVQADICDGAAMRATLAGFQPEAILHLAAESHVDRSIDSAAAFIQTNLVGTATLLDEARRYWEALPGARKEAFRFVHISTDEVYGSLGADGLFTEETPYDPSSPYSASKAGSDHLVTAWRRTYGLPTLMTNCSNNYGPYHLPEKLIPLMILNALEGQPLPVYGDGSNVRDWLYVEDHARALLLVLEKGVVGGKYNVGGRNERTNLDVVRTICDLVDDRRPGAGSRRDLIRFVTDRPGHDARYAIDATKLETELGWKAREDFDSGLARTVDWYLANEWWWGPLRAHAAERKGLKAPAKAPA